MSHIVKTNKLWCHDDCVTTNCHFHSNKDSNKRHDKKQNVWFVRKTSNFSLRRNAALAYSSCAAHVAMIEKCSFPFLFSQYTIFSEVENAFIRPARPGAIAPLSPSPQGLLYERLPCLSQKGPFFKCTECVHNKVLPECVPEKNDYLIILLHNTSTPCFTQLK